MCRGETKQQQAACPWPRRTRRCGARARRRCWMARWVPLAQLLQWRSCCSGAAAAVAQLLLWRSCCCGAAAAVAQLLQWRSCCSGASICGATPLSCIDGLRDRLAARTGTTARLVHAQQVHHEPPPPARAAGRLRGIAARQHPPPQPHGPPAFLQVLLEGSPSYVMVPCSACRLKQWVARPLPPGPLLPCCPPLPQHLLHHAARGMVDPQAALSPPIPCPPLAGGRPTRASS